MAEFKSDSIAVGTLLSQDWFFRIPAYQRPFAWDDEHFDDLIVDTKEADRGAPYFMGTMVMHREQDGIVSVVDGQQRLTSMLILLACLRDSIDDDKYKSEIQSKIMQGAKLIDGIPERVRLEVKDREIFKNVVVSFDGTKYNPNPADLSPSERRYIDACRIFHRRLDEMDQPSRKDLVTFLNRNCVVIYLMADNFEQAYRLFEIVNDRGKQLRRIDILKSKNISPEVIGSQNVRETIARQWESLESEVGEDVFESVFFLIRLIILKDKPKGDLLREFEDRIFKQKLIQKGEPFVELLFRYIRLYQEIFIDMTFLEEDDKFNIKYPALIHIMDLEFKASEWRACLLSFAMKFGRSEFYQFCLAVEKMFLTQWVQGIRKDERYADYAKLLAAIDSEKEPSAVVAAVPSDAGAIIGGVTRENLYGAGYCKYALLRLELLASEHDVPKRLTARSIEHVFPQNPAAGSDWLQGGVVKDLDKFVNRVGNLVLISRGKNSSASNMEFLDKKKKYLSPRVTDYPRSVEVLAYEKWDSDVITARTNDVAKRFLDDI